MDQSLILEHPAAGRFPPVAACVLTYNSRQWIRRCLTSLLESDYPDLTVLVVDNDSQDGTGEAVRPFLPSIHYLPTHVNLGYAEGNNVGMRWAMGRGAQYVMILNPDTWVEPDTVSKLVRAAEANPRYGILSPQQMDYDGAALDPNFRRTLDVDTSDNALLQPDAHPEVLPIGRVIGAAILLSRRLLEQVGGFDPIYFAYGEEEDLCRRARYHGWRMGIVPPARIGHWHAAVHDEAQGVVSDTMFRAQYVFALKDLNLPWVKRYLRFIKASASCAVRLFTRPGPVTLRQFGMLQTFFLKNLFRFERHVRRERLGPAHLADRPNPCRPLRAAALSCNA